MSYISNISEEFIEVLYSQWINDPDSIDTDWQIYFTGFKIGSKQNHEPYDFQTDRSFTAQEMMYRYRSFGYLMACTDPLSPCSLYHPLLEVSGIYSDEEATDKIYQNGLATDSRTTIRQLIADLRKTYCHEIGVEFMHMRDVAEQQWLIARMEQNCISTEFRVSDRISFLELLHKATCFETLLQRNFPAQKRFSLEGGEILVLALDTVVSSAASANIDDIVFGMAHRGRLNVLAHIFDKPIEIIIAEFRDTAESGFVGDGDVKYHKGISTDRVRSDYRIHLTLVSNPSHLEAVNSVVEGKCRARQDRYEESGINKVLPVLIHGDAAFAGQGSIMEVLNLSQLDGYRTGGTIHIVLNNQIGFTTAPKDARSTSYATDIARMIDCPIFHVQGESPEAVVHVMRLALDCRQQFHKDIVIELICYRRHGHNEGDEPSFTQPLMYRNIVERPSVNRIYSHTLRESRIDPDLLDAVEERVRSEMEACFSRQPESRSIGFRDAWSSVAREFSYEQVDTSVTAEKLLLLARRLADLPPGFIPHPKIHTLVQKRFESVLKGSSLDWGTAETLAYATLLDEGISVRISGQDSRRGTFSHRHCVLHDINTDATYAPLASVAPPGISFQCWDSPLSEFGVLGFEYGYSLESPNGLTIWEAQFGDFVNGAQVIIDQFLVSGETKWNRASGLVLFLPHGYEGQGAEHSSARIERFLQLCAGDNIVVAYPSTPAQMFHLLRRQIKQSFRKPLIVFTPKSLLRHPACISTVDDVCSGSFQEIICSATEEAGVKSILMCSGKIFYDLMDERTKPGRHETAIIRIEQLYPFRMDLLEKLLSKFPRKARISWVQEEPENMGAWQFLQPQLAKLRPGIRYVGRRPDSCPAVGSHRTHLIQQQEILDMAFDIS